ncbi:MAG: ywhC [Candidatus Saccharibacteria bacterium]|nr:ywhC [Candidatus Saccharibacteria bacterium]
MYMNFSPSDLLIIIPIIFISMAIHEAVHAYVAHALGDTTASEEGRITLNPFKHIDLYMTILLPAVLILLSLPPIFAAKPVPFDPMRVKYEEFGVALIGISGPISNLFLAMAAAILYKAVPLVGLPKNVVLTFIIINISFFVFNMIPFPPLDGSRLLYAFAPEPLQKLMHQIESMGFMAIILFFILLVPVLGPLITEAVQAILVLLLPGVYQL